MSESKLYPHSSGVAIYVRESRDENEENLDTIETQKSLLLCYARDKKLGTVYRVYTDDNVSGTTYDRPGIKELEKDVLDGHINILLIKDLSRLGRNNAKTLIFLDFLEEHGVRVISSDGRFDSNSDTDLVGIETWFNERYAKDISRKIRTNLKHKISKGEFLGKPPYGYIKSINQKNTLQINEEQAQIVRQIYKMYLDGYGYKKIAEFLSEKGIPSPSGVKGISSHTQKWNSIAVSRILSNRVYLGETIQGVSEKISFKSKKTRRLPVENWVVTPGTHEKIIDENTFKAAELVRNSKKSTFTCSDKGTIHTYRGMVFCGRCGAVMFARKRRGRELGYVCQNYTRNGKAACSSHFIKESEINSVIALELKKLPENEDIIKVLNKYFVGKAPAGRGMDDYEKALANINSLKLKQEKIYMDMLEGLITKELFIRVNNNIEQSIGRFKDVLSQNQASDQFMIDSKVWLNEIISMCEENKLPYQLSNILIKKITVFDKGECLQSNLQGENIQMNDTDGTIIIEFKSYLM